MKEIKDAKRVVVKVGTSTLTYPNGKLNLRTMSKLALVLTDLKNSGKQVILVSSGAIGAGMGKLGLEKRPTETKDKQACAAVGQCELIYLYDKFFSEYGSAIAQVLLTPDVIEISNKKENVTNTFEVLLRMGVTPIVNANDTVATDELKMSELNENDTLAAMVAEITKSDALIILSDIDGLYDCNPKQNKDAKLINVVEYIDDNIKKMAGGAGSKFGTGGMATKIKAAELVTGEGISMVVAKGDDPAILYDIFDGSAKCTFFRKN